ncbi:hypothetical protein CMO91_01360 [Candidatus Woesearchaeota archaeon]|nr:hypothetical protein [Candidatus Woesearchaeota archaeon]
MRRVLVAIAVLALITLIACGKPPEPEPQPPAPTQPVVVNVTETVKADPCKDVSCGKNEECREGTCFCAGEFKECGGACVPTSNCCTKDDCGVQESCIEGGCKQTEFCDYLQEYNEEEKKCECKRGTRFCFDQQKCVDVQSCCDIADCNPLGGFDRFCTQTRFRLDLCLKFEGGEHCRKAIMGERNQYSFGGKDYDLYITSLHEGAVADLSVGNFNESLNFTSVRVNESAYKGGVTINNYGGEIFGGTCKED